MKIPKDQGNTSFLSDLSAMNIIMIVVMITGFYATTVSFRTHVSDFERQTREELGYLKENDKVLERRIRPIELKSVKMDSELKYIHEGIDKINEKLDKLASEK